MARGSAIEIRFNRAPTTRCPDPLSQYPGDQYSVWLYNNPVRDRGAITFDQSIPLVDGIPESAGRVTATIPADLPGVNDTSLWYLRLDTTLSTAPQVGALPNEVPANWARCRVSSMPRDRLQLLDLLLFSDWLLRLDMMTLHMLEYSSIRVDRKSELLALCKRQRSKRLDADSCPFTYNPGE